MMLKSVICTLVLIGCTGGSKSSAVIEEPRVLPGDQVIVRQLSDGGFHALAATQLSDGGWRDLSEVDPNPPRPPPSPDELAARFPPIYRTSLCGGGPEDESHVYMDGLQLPDKSVDYIELRHGDEIQGRAGWRCSRSATVERCEPAYRAVKSPALTGLPGAVETPPWGAGLPAVSLPMYLVVERAGAFSVVATENELAALLGPVDTLAEAALLVKLRGYVFQCRESLRDTRSTGQAEGTGWRVTAMSRAPGQTPGDPSLP
ncbi:MAG: hypothetical protein EOO70_08985, partial [Myxococcaceae bacterium]